MEAKTSSYNNEWFKKRAISTLKKVDEDTWDYSDSLLLYISSDGSKTYESLQETDTPYFKLVTKPEREYLEAIAKDIAETLPDNFEYIDLGPGTEHKEQFLFDELKKLGKNFTYIPVDISQYYLDLAVEHASAQGIDTRSMKSSFEELPKKLGEPTSPRFVSLGLTFSNYEPQEILKLLKDIAGKGGYAFINSQMRDRVDMKELQKIYAEDATDMCDEKLELLGFDPKEDVSAREADEGVQVWCFVLKINSELERFGFKVGDRVLVFQSLRYTKESLVHELEESSSTFKIFDTGSSFISTLIET